nr:MAG TPA: hypothetical protein [Caudoviricetes sp.]
MTYILTYGKTLVKWGFSQCAIQDKSRYGR